MHRPRIALIVDHPQRDLAGLLLVAFELCQRGAQCYLVPLNLQDTEVMALAPDFVLLNYMRSANLRLARRMVECGLRFGMLDTEGGVWEDFQSYTELLWPDKELLQRAAGVCMWGPVLARHCLENGYFSRRGTVVTGCPRLDLYHASWRPALSERPTASRTGSPAGHGNILINANFSVGNPRFTSVQKSIEYCHREYGWSYECIQKVIAAETSAMQGLIELARTLRRDFPAARIVVRPHPFENPQPYIDRLQDLDRVEINGEGPVTSQISRADVVIQRSCTTAIEAAAAAVPAFSPQWIPAPYLMPVAEAVSVPCDSYEELRNRVAASLRGDYQPTEELRLSIQTMIHDWFHRIDGASYLRVADVVYGCLEAAGRVDRSRCTKYLYGLRGPTQSLSDTVSGMVRHRLGLSPDWSFRRGRPVPNLLWVGTAKHLHLHEARAIVQRIEKVRRRQSSGIRSADVQLARTRGDYARNYFGHSLALSCVH